MRGLVQTNTAQERGQGSPIEQFLKHLAGLVGPPQTGVIFTGGEVVVVVSGEAQAAPGLGIR